MPDAMSPDPEVVALRAVLPRAINFRFLPPKHVNHPIWGEIALDILAALHAAGYRVVAAESDTQFRDRMLGTVFAPTEEERQHDVGPLDEDTTEE